MIVVDATVLGDWAFGDDEERARAVKLSEIEPVWITSGLFRYELGNVAWKTARFAKGWDFERAAAAMASASGLPEEIEVVTDWAAVLKLALEREISYYDAAYVSLALSRGLPLFSRDGPLRRKCPEVVRAMPEV